MKDKNIRFDSVLLGMVAGLVVPVITFIIFWAFREDVSLGDFIVQLQTIGALSKLVSLSVIPNLLLFFVFNWIEKLYSARGVLFATIIYGLLIIILKLV